MRGGLLVLDESNGEAKKQLERMQEREVKRVGYIVVSSDRGLCGGLNTNAFKLLVREMREWKQQGIETDICAIGQKGASFFRNYGGNVVAAVTHLGDSPSADQLIGSVKVMLDSFVEGKIDRLFLISNEFVNTMTQSPKALQLLPQFVAAQDVLLVQGAGNVSTISNTLTDHVG